MVQMPAVCLTCGTIFPSGLVVQNYVVQLEGNVAGPCPQCGGTGHIPDGLFEFVGSTIRVLAAPEQSVDALRRLQVIIEDARRKRTSPQQVAEAVEKQSPALGALIQQRVIPRNPTEFYAFLTFLIMAITLVLSLKQQPQEITNIDVERQVVQVIEDCASPNLVEQNVSQLPPEAEQKPSHDHKPGERDP
jgi:hypothetical protein